MSNKIKHKRSGVSGHVPVVTDFDSSEILYNYADGIAYFKKILAGVEIVVEFHGSETPHLLKNLSTPTKPLDGFLKLYAKNDTLYTLNSAGIEVPVAGNSAIHNHDDRYFTETETDERYASINHDHSGLYLDASKIYEIFAGTTEVAGYNKAAWDTVANDFSHHRNAGGDEHALATQSQAGFMSSSDKSKLDNLTGTGGSSIFETVLTGTLPITGWTAVLSHNITIPGTYLILAQLQLFRSGATYLGGRITLNGISFSSGELYESIRAQITLNGIVTIEAITKEMTISLEGYSNAPTGTLAYGATPVSGAECATFLKVLKIA